LQIESLIDRRVLGIGPAVILANWTRTNISDDRFSTAAGKQLDYVLNHSPHTDDGAISHRTKQVQLWYDESPLAIARCLRLVITR
jgi:rhamnogalacturonyl hydrolase YesR